MTNSASDTHAALTSQLQAVVASQKALAWTTPALSASLDSVTASVAKIGATLSLSATAASAASSSSGAGSGVKTDALSLGVGVSAATAASLSAGVSLGIGFSASASIAAALNTNLHTSIALVADLQRKLTGLNAQSASMAGTNGVMPPGRAADSSSVDAAIRALSSNLDEAQSQAQAQAPPAPIELITGELRMSRMGAWYADVATDDETALSGKITFSIDEQSFTGTVVPTNTGIDGSRARCRIAAGNGRHAAIISGKSYTGGAGVRVGAVLRDILHDCGEDLSDLADGPTLDRTLPRWHVSEGPAHAALVDLADAAGCSWRTLRDGKIWFGPETWPIVTPDHRVVDEDYSAGALTLAPDTPDMVPGVVFNGIRVEHVIHHLGPTLRSEIRADHPAAALTRFLAGQRRGVDYSRDWPCKVVTQNTDGTVQLLPDDDVMKARGLDHVPIRYGIPGFVAKIKNGARCHLAFAGGDPSRPFAHNWEPDKDAVESVEFQTSGRSAGVARIGDALQIFFAPGVPIPISGTLSGASFAGIITIATPLVGVVQSGNPSFKA